MWIKSKKNQDNQTWTSLLAVGALLTLQLHNSTPNISVNVNTNTSSNSNIGSNFTIYLVNNTNTNGRTLGMESSIIRTSLGGVHPMQMASRILNSQSRIPNSGFHSFHHMVSRIPNSQFRIPNFEDWIDNKGPKIDLFLPWEENFLQEKPLRNLEQGYRNRYNPIDRPSGSCYFWEINIRSLILKHEKDFL